MQNVCTNCFRDLSVVVTCTLDCRHQVCLDCAWNIAVVSGSCLCLVCKKITNYGSFEGGMTVFVKSLTGITNTLSVKEYSTIEDVKAIMALQRGDCSYSDQIKLIYDGKQLENDRSLTSYGILSESIITQTT